MLCPHCDHEVGEDSIDSLEGICPMCEGSLSKSSSMWDDADGYDREYTEDDFEDEFDEEKSDSDDVVDEEVDELDEDLDDLDEDEDEI